MISDSVVIAGLVTLVQLLVLLLGRVVANRAEKAEKDLAENIAALKNQNMLQEQRLRANELAMPHEGEQRLREVELKWERLDARIKSAQSELDDLADNQRDLRYLVDTKVSKSSTASMQAVRRQDPPVRREEDSEPPPFRGPRR